jgi:hypothetical protein
MITNWPQNFVANLTPVGRASTVFATPLRLTRIGMTLSSKVTGYQRCLTSESRLAESETPLNSAFHFNFNVAPSTELL